MIEDPETQKIKVWTDYEAIATFLTDNRYELVGNPNDAHIVWSHVDYYKVV